MTANAASTSLACSSALTTLKRNKRELGVLLRYLRHGYSRAQVTRLVAQWGQRRLATLPLAKRYCAPSAPFARKYTPGDVSLLVEMDKASEDVCGPAIGHLLKRAFKVYGDARYERLADLSVSHLYNLRKSAGYQHQRANYLGLIYQDPPSMQRHWCAQGATAQPESRLCAH